MALAPVLALVPRLALACPSCARDGGGSARLVILAVMILFPFAVVGVVLRVIRRFEPDDDPVSDWRQTG